MPHYFHRQKYPKTAKLPTCIADNNYTHTNNSTLYGSTGDSIDEINTH